MGIHWAKVCEGMRRHHSTQNGKQFKIYKLCIPGIVCLLLLDRGTQISYTSLRNDSIPFLCIKISFEIQEIVMPRRDFMFFLIYLKIRVREKKSEVIFEIRSNKWYGSFANPLLKLLTAQHSCSAISLLIFFFIQLDSSTYLLHSHISKGIITKSNSTPKR